MSSKQACTTRRTGLRNSSIGVPMVTITGPLVEMLVGRAGEDEALFRQRLGEYGLGAVFEERQPPAFEGIEALLVEIVDVDAQAGLDQRQHQRHADMAGAADDGNVGVVDRRCGAGSADIGPDGHLKLFPAGEDEGAEPPHRRQIEHGAVDEIIDRQ